MALPGRVVSTTQMVSVAGSAQQMVPVDPVWPNVVSEQPGLPAAGPTLNPSPRGANPWRFWLLTIIFAVSGLTRAPLPNRNSPRNRSKSGADAWAPPHG